MIDRQARRLTLDPSRAGAPAGTGRAAVIDRRRCRQANVVVVRIVLTLWMTVRASIGVGDDGAAAARACITDSAVRFLTTYRQADAAAAAAAARACVHACSGIDRSIPSTRARFLSTRFGIQCWQWCSAHGPGASPVATSHRPAATATATAACSRHTCRMRRWGSE